MGTPYQFNHSVWEWAATLQYFFLKDFQVIPLGSEVWEPLP